MTIEPARTAPTVAVAVAFVIMAVALVAMAVAMLCMALCVDVAFMAVALVAMAFMAVAMRACGLMAVAVTVGLTVLPVVMILQGHDKWALT